MTFGFPQLIYTVIAVIGLWMEMEKHDELKTGRHNFITTFISQVLGFALLYWGGFFN